MNTFLSVWLPVVLPILIAVYHYVVFHLPAKREAEYQHAVSSVRNVVGMVQQTAKDAPGADKKAQAMAALKLLHINLSDSALNILVEAEVFALNSLQSHS